MEGPPTLPFARRSSFRPDRPLVELVRLSLFNEKERTRLKFNVPAVHDAPSPARQNKKPPIETGPASFGAGPGGRERSPSCLLLTKDKSEIVWSCRGFPRDLQATILSAKGDIQ